MALASLLIGSMTGLLAAGASVALLGAGVLGAIGIYSLVGTVTTLALSVALYLRANLTERAHEQMSAVHMN